MAGTREVPEPKRSDLRELIEFYTAECDRQAEQETLRLGVRKPGVEDDPETDVRDDVTISTYQSIEACRAAVEDIAAAAYRKVYEHIEQGCSSEGRMVELRPGHRTQLSDGACSERNIPRFARRFADDWQRSPAADAAPTPEISPHAPPASRTGQGQRFSPTAAPRRRSEPSPAAAPEESRQRNRVVSGSSFRVTTPNDVEITREQHQALQRRCGELYPRARQYEFVITYNHMRRNYTGTIRYQDEQGNWKTGNMRTGRSPDAVIQSLLTAD